MKTKVFSATPEVVERLLNHWMTGGEGPAEVISITQSQSLRQSGNTELTVLVYYRAKPSTAGVKFQDPSAHLAMLA